ncbi:MAG TPA: acyl-CoA dehydrogenase [Actinobacteria bacterium]|nr:acyl-CoA dehydrogenase [Actinomycetota bacterium]
MDDYTVPLRDIRFVLDHVCRLEEITTFPGFEHVDVDTVDGLLVEAARFMEEVFAPTNRIGDLVGSRFVDGEVVTPDEFKKAWRAYVEAGWNAVSGPPEYGGGGFPHVVGFAISEMMTASNLAFSLCPMLTGSAITVLDDQPDETLKATYLEKLVTAEWTGTMVLTEPEAGSDVGALRTKAEPSDDGTWAITGTKIFITWGEHDLAENIVHLVLARTPGAPPGTKGISLFVVPKYVVGDDGSFEENGVRCVSIEHKLGIHGSPTCVLEFEEAKGWMVGEEHRGMRYMFKMMNQARVEVGLEGLAVAERAYQKALRYARERLQGRAVGAPPHERSPIIEHPDVRRMLMTMKAYDEAMRGLLYDVAGSVDRSRHHPDDVVREAAAARVALLTPVAKAWCTDVGVEMTSIGLQVHGGMGYVEETGVAQYYRDSRITPIYEGTNGIQAVDLVLRKLPMHGGRVVREYLAEIEGLDAPLAEAGPRFAAMRRELAEALRVLSEATTWLLGRDDPRDVLAGATPYLRMFGTVAGGAYLVRLALAAAKDGEDPWLRAKVATADFYARELLPSAVGLLGAVKAGAAPLYALDPEQLAPAR